ncbi:hypothetical protein MMC24_000297 [Lignoscripta atroalba]|nr:hypothetical protein [Lignoscripta atroalba]
MLTSFFGWKASSPIVESSPTTTDRSHSPGHSPLSPAPSSFPSSIRSVPHAIDVPKANASIQTAYFAHPNHPLPPPTPGMSIQIEEMEEELREISSELAGSIRREIELEDQVERLQLEVSQPPEISRRTSDYFSDSGTSSVRCPLSEVGGNKSEDLEKMKRRSEQEKAQLKLDVSQKLQDERGRRKALEAHIRILEDRLQAVEHEHVRSSGTTGRVQELEVALEENRRRLQEERRGKENFEDLLTALRGEIEQHRNERDNLRDEVVPQLRARVEGLEAEAADFQRLTYENTRMQQELASLKNENIALVNTKKLQLDLQQNSPRIGSIAEEEGSAAITPTSKTGLTRSTSLARGMGGSSTKVGSLSRSNSASTKERESRDSLADRVKDIELQRDSLHRALKSLLDRQKYQTREHEKRVKALEMERDRALQAHSPRRVGYEKEVAGLRHEINHLRHRADEALEQKWQCEKGLGGLKKDLDRAKQETGSLQTLLHENDILIPETSDMSSQGVRADTYATSASLEKAYKELKASQALSIARLRDLKGAVPTGADDAKTQETMGLLLKTMSDAEVEREFAQKQAETYRAQAESLQEATSFHEGENAGLAEQLRASANRVEALASQVRYQLESNSGLRQRLAEAVGRGEREQKTSADRINNVQGKLKTLEDRLMAAQQHSEEAVQMHEDEVRGIRDSHNTQLQRLKNGLKSPTSLNPNAKLTPGGSPRSPLFFGARSPRLKDTSSGLGMSMGEALRTEFLEKRVTELEGALGEADSEMEEVVQRMNAAQIEVMELQSARDEAIRQTRKLQAEIVAEREKVDSLMKPDSMMDSFLAQIPQFR